MTIDCTTSNSAAERPIGKTQSFSIMFDQWDVFTISSLLIWGCPFAIIWAVTQIIFNPFKAMFGRWPWSHIPIKDRKIFPFWAYNDSATSIISMGTVILVIASLTHMLPYSPFWSGTHSMGAGHLPKLFFVKTATTLSLASPQTGSGYNFSFPAVTLAKPKSIASPTSIGFSGISTNYSKATEAVPDMVYDWSHVLSPYTWRHNIKRIG